MRIISACDSKFLFGDFPKLDDDEVQKQHAAMQNKLQTIRELYVGGAPLFTRELLEECAAQMDRLRAGDEVTLRATGIDGVLVEDDKPTRLLAEDDELMSLMRSRIRESSDENVEADLVCIGPYIKYHSIEQMLVGWHFHDYYQLKAFLPVKFNHMLAERDPHTKELRHNPPVVAAADIRRALQESRRAWEASDHFGQLASLLSTITLPCPITNVVGFALGSLTHNSAPNESTLRQHNLLLAFRRLLAPSPAPAPGDADADADSSDDTPCLVQDPVYTLPDKEALAKEGVTVLGDPWGFLAVNNGSVVLSVAPNEPVKQVLAELCRPAVIVWTDDSEFDLPEGSFSTDPTSSRVREMLEGYDMLPEFSECVNLKWVKMYVRRGNV